MICRRVFGANGSLGLGNLWGLVPACPSSCSPSQRGSSCQARMEYYDPARKEMRNVRKGHKCDRISAEKRANTARLMKRMPSMLADYRKRRWELKMKAEDDAVKKALQE